MTINLNGLGGGGGGGFYKLAPDLDRIAEQATSSAGFKTITGIDASGALTTVLSLTGKWLLTTAVLSGTLAESMTLKLTVDGVVIIDSTFTANSNGVAVLGLATANITNPMLDAYGYCETSILLEVQTTSDTSIILQYNARPIA